MCNLTIYLGQTWTLSAVAPALIIPTHSKWSLTAGEEYIVRSQSGVRGRSSICVGLPTESSTLHLKARLFWSVVDAPLSRIVAEKIYLSEYKIYLLYEVNSQKMSVAEEQLVTTSVCLLYKSLGQDFKNKMPANSFCIILWDIWPLALGGGGCYTPAFFAVSLCPWMVLLPIHPPWEF